MHRGKWSVIAHPEISLKPDYFGLLFFASHECGGWLSGWLGLAELLIFSEELVE